MSQVRISARTRRKLDELKILVEDYDSSYVLSSLDSVIAYAVNQQINYLKNSFFVSWCHDCDAYRPENHDCKQQ